MHNVFTQNFTEKVKFIKPRKTRLSALEHVKIMRMIKIGVMKQKQIIREEKSVKELHQIRCEGEQGLSASAKDRPTHLLPENLQVRKPMT